MTKNCDFIYIDPTEIEEHFYGSGGKSILSSFLRNAGDKMCFVGLGRDKFTVGKWREINWSHNKIKFFSVGTFNEILKKPQGMRNLFFTLKVLRYKNMIFRGCQNYNKIIFTRTTFIFWWFTIFEKNLRVCFFAPGLRFSDFFNRHNYSKFLKFIFKKIYVNAINRSYKFFAAASKKEIEKFYREINSFINKEICQIPTFVNLDVFYPRNKLKVRVEYSLPLDIPIFIFVGRLARVKGIDFLIDSFKFYLDNWGNGLLIIVGDGEEKIKLTRKVKELSLNDKVIFKGENPPQVVADFIGAADVALIGSLLEGFSVAMVEEFVTGIPIVSTNVSGVEEIIKPGVNGYIVYKRDPSIFASKMAEALKLKGVVNYNKNFFEKFDEAIWVRRIFNMCIDNENRKF